MGLEMLSLLLFFFKQKTAYEMRISDWSSDVCSSDLRGRGTRCPSHPRRARSTGLSRRAMTTAITQAAAAILPIGDNQTLLWGMTARERLRRIAAAHKLAFDAAAPGTVLLASLDSAFDPPRVAPPAAKPRPAVPRAGLPGLPPLPPPPP